MQQCQIIFRAGSSLPKIVRKKLICSIFFMGLQSFTPCWDREKGGIGYQDALDGEILQSPVTG